MKKKRNKSERKQKQNQTSLENNRIWLALIWICYRKITVVVEKNKWARFCKLVIFLILIRKWTTFDCVSYLIILGGLKKKNSHKKKIIKKRWERRG